MAQVGRAGVAALAALLVVDVALVALAFRHVQSGALSSGQASTLPTVSSTPTAEPDPGKSNPPKKSTPPPKPATADHLLIDIGSEKAVARATPGVCGQGGGKLELSTDGGETWKASDLPDAQVILRVASKNVDETEIVAMGKDCKDTTTYKTVDGGGKWEDSKGSADKWHRLSGESTKVHAPTGSVAVQCANGENVIALSTLSGDEAFALCSDGALLKTSDSGADWEPAGDIQKATDMDFVGSRTGLAVLPPGGDCKGVSVQRTKDGGESWDEADCIKTTATGVPDVSVDDGERAYVTLGPKVWFSEDGGDSWEPRGN